MQYAAVDSVWPQWHVWRHFIHREFEPAMHHDLVGDTHPLEDFFYWHSAGEHFNKHWMFNSKEAIVSSKAAAIHRMVYHFVGHEVCLLLIGL